ncbi:hypothetical protein ACUWC2_28930, partial [Klebsiella pneumoniae]|uniref:hypothetical protein n=1 Tax=Klebsiella pneumoniae TaxID=573 RepID=UPI0040558BEA
DNELIPAVRSSCFTTVVVFEETTTGGGFLAAWDCPCTLVFSEEFSGRLASTSYWFLWVTGVGAFGTGIFAVFFGSLN